ncbi:MAG: DUF58 domain-containing protein [Crocinitomicaceae bacterium]
METVELLKKIRRLEIKTKGLTKQIFSGEYHSAFKGKGMAFSEVRNYLHGDEVRTIDWNVTARFDEPFVKVFEEERELTVMLVVDVSASGSFAVNDKSKKDLAIEIAAVLAFSAINNNDKIGAIFVSDEVEKYIPANKGRKHALLILRELIEFKPQNKGTNITEGLRFLRNTQKKRCISFVLSDFIDNSDYTESLQLNDRKHDMVAIHLYDKGELFLPKLGLIQVRNLETGKLSWINSSNDEVRSKYQETFELKQKELIHDLNKKGIDAVSVSTEEDFILPLVYLFKHRKR